MKPRRISKVYTGRASWRDPEGERVGLYVGFPRDPSEEMIVLTANSLSTSMPTTFTVINRAEALALSDALRRAALS